MKKRIGKYCWEYLLHKFLMWGEFGGTQECMRFATHYCHSRPVWGKFLRWGWNEYNRKRDLEIPPPGQEWDEIAHLRRFESRFRLKEEE